jgi:intein-encoded DNA endonuclease-like protein
MSNKASGAVNQQATLSHFGTRESSETIRQAPLSKREIKAYLLGAIHDGTLNKGKKIRISQKGTDWLRLLQRLLKKIGYNSWIYKEGKNRKVYVLETLADFLDFNFDPLRLKTKKEKIGYLRGFFDAEGGIPRTAKGKFYIQLVQKDKGKLEKIKKLLEELRIKTGKLHNPNKRIDPNYWRLYVLKESWQRFVRVIGSWHSRKIRALGKRMKIWSTPYSDIGVT